MGELTKEHGGELRPAGEPFGVTLALVLAHQFGEFVARDLLKQLTEETGGLYHESALRVACYEPSIRQPDSPTPTEGLVNLTFRTAV